VARRHASNMAGRGFSPTSTVRGDVPDRLARPAFPGAASRRTCSRSGATTIRPLAVLSWMESPGHRKNILDKEVTLAGVGAPRRRDGALFLAQEFLRP